MKGIYLAALLFCSLILSQYVLFDRNSGLESDSSIAPVETVQQSEKDLIKLFEDDDITVFKKGAEFIVIPKRMST